MGQFLPISHCPTKSVALCAVGEAYPQVCEQLLKQNIEIFTISANGSLSEPVRFHPDLQLGMLTGECIAIGKGENMLQNRLEQFGFSTVETAFPLSDQYPQEAVLDFLSLGEKIIGNHDILKKNNLLNNSQSIHVKQGYAKCSITVISSTALITADQSIANICIKHGFDVLQIRPGYIELPGYHYGFIGGCCGLIAPDCLAVCGDLQTHPDYERITAFLQKHHVTALPLINGTLQDIGGIIPMKQR